MSHCAKKFLFLLLATAFLSMGASAKIVVGTSDWPSIQAKAHILKILIEERLGFEVEFKQGSGVNILHEIDKGTTHIHPEVWIPHYEDAAKAYTATGTLLASTGAGAQAGQGMCTTEATVTRTGIKDIQDLTKPEIASQFDSNGDGKGDLWIGAATWTSTVVEQIRAKSYGYDRTMNMNIKDEVQAMNEINNAIVNNRNVIFSCYYPHYSFAMYNLVLLNEPAHNPATWSVVRPEDDPNWLEVSNASSAWKTGSVNVYHASSLATTHPSVAKMIARATFSGQATSEMSYELGVKKTVAETYARQWITANSTIVDSWFQ